MARDTARPRTTKVSSKPTSRVVDSESILSTPSKLSNGQRDTQEHNSRVEHAWEEAGAPKIPSGLSVDENIVYQRLIELRRTRGCEGQSPPEVVDIEDLAKDYDDLSGKIALKELHRLGLIRLRGFITNLHPAKDRAKFGRVCLDYLGLEDMIICWGEQAQADPLKLEDPEPWEFPYDKTYFKDLSAIHVSFTPYGQDKLDKADRNEIQSGVKFLEDIIEEKVTSISKDPDTPKLTFLLTSGLADAATIAKREPENLALAIGNVVLQGDYNIEQGQLKPNLKAANNSFDAQAATQFHAYIDKYHIPSVVYTRAPAMCAKMDSQLFRDLKAIGHPLGQHLEEAQKLQDASYYARACNPDPKKRFLPHLDQQWFLNGKTNWYEKNPRYPQDGSRPKTPPAIEDAESIIPYVQLVFYDVLAAIGAGGDDLLQALQVLDPAELFANQEPSIHKIVGREEANHDPDAKPKIIQIPEINVKNMKTVISALLKGSLLAVEQNIPSTHTTWEMWTQANEQAALNST